MKTREFEKKKVLVVDDELNCRSLICQMLGDVGMVCQEVSNGKEAIQQLQKEIPDLIISDIFMPDMDGYALCHYVKQTFTERFIPIILITGRLDPETYQKAIAAGVDEFLPKPFQQTVLMMRIRSLLKLKKLYEEKEESLNKLKETEILKQELVQMIAHDMKNPLTAIRGYSELLSIDETIQSYPHIRGFIDKMLQGCDDLMRMILNFLDLSKMEEGNFSLKKTSFDILKVVKEVLSKYEAVIKRTGHAIQLDFDLKQSHLVADKELVERVISNLVNNAMKYSPENTKVFIKLSQRNGFYRFSVQDAGEGIPKEFHQLIFEKFNRVRDMSQTMKSDTGLGLAFCKRAIEAHQGKIWVESEVGKGSCFIFEVPAE